MRQAADAGGGTSDRKSNAPHASKQAKTNMNARLRRRRTHAATLPAAITPALRLRK